MSEFAIGAVNGNDYSLRYSKKSSSQNISDKSVFLQSELERVKSEQGVFGKAWNSIKEGTNLGLSFSDCENMAEKYENGELSFEEAIDYINQYEQKQDTMTNLFENVVTGTAAIAVSVATGGVALPAAIAVGSAVGAGTKTALGAIDRGTNEVDNDEFDMKEIGKDFITGAVTGATSAVSSGVSEGIKAGVKAVSVKNGVKCGLACGAVSGSTGYLTDVAFDDNKEFNFGEFAKSTATSAIVSGTVGGVVGAGLYDISAHAGNVGANYVGAGNTMHIIAKDSASSTARKGLGQIFRNVMKTAQEIFA